MRNFGRSFTRVAFTAFAAWLSVCAIADAQAVKPQAQAQTVKQRFDDAMAKDDKVRLVLTNYADKTPPKDLAVQVSQVMTSFEQLVRRFPASSYADDALWRAASLGRSCRRRKSKWSGSRRNEVWFVARASIIALSDSPVESSTMLR